VKAIILAAGKGTRLSPFTDNFPKSMIKLFDKSLLEMQINNFKDCGINDITIVTGYKNEKIVFPGIKMKKNKNFASTNMNESLFCVQEEMNDSVIISYGDIIYDKTVIKKLIEFNGNVGIAIRTKWRDDYINRDLHPTSEAENVLFENEKIIKIEKNITEKTEKQGIGEFLGLIKLSENGCKLFLQTYSNLKKTHKGKFHSSTSLETAYLTDMIQEIINLKNNVEIINIDGKWFEIDTMQDIDNVREKIFDV
tara:strand:- start:2915 stop:3670 length:756 start_codon:yes stop_codon:yes gene_type:complete